MPQIGRTQLAAYAVFAVVVVVLGVRFMQRQRAGPAAGASAGAAAPGPRGGADAGDGAGAGAGAVQIGTPRGAASVVHVAGAVRAPGVYRLAAGARVEDAVRRAGGARPGADVNAINLAAKVVDGQQVVVPVRAQGAAATAAPGAAAARTPVSLNGASAEQLDTLDGVGPATARKIIEWRTQHGGFRSIDDLGQVPGIGPKKLAALRGQVQP